MSASAAEALALLARERPDAALLGVKVLNGEVDLMVRSLAARGEPYGVVTGYECTDLAATALAGAPCLPKPYSVTGLHHLLHQLLHPG